MTGRQAFQLTFSMYKQDVLSIYLPNILRNSKQYKQRLGFNNYALKTSLTTSINRITSNFSQKTLEKLSDELIKNPGEKNKKLKPQCKKKN